MLTAEVPWLEIFKAAVELRQALMLAAGGARR
jgi:hypothetical protein